MGKAIKCDRCNKFEEGEGMKFEAALPHRICEDCNQSSEKWWVEGDEDNHLGTM